MRTDVSEAMKGKSPAMTMPPSTPIPFWDRLSLEKECASISLIGLSLKDSILVFERTAAESCEMPSPETPLKRTSSLVREALTYKASEMAMMPSEV